MPTDDELRQAQELCQQIIDLCRRTHPDVARSALSNALIYVLCDVEPPPWSADVDEVFEDIKAAARERLGIIPEGH